MGKEIWQRAITRLEEQEAERKQQEAGIQQGASMLSEFIVSEDGITALELLSLSKSGLCVAVFSGELESVSVVFSERGPQRFFEKFKQGEIVESVDSLHGHNISTEEFVRAMAVNTQWKGNTMEAILRAMLNRLADKIIQQPK